MASFPDTTVTNALLPSTLQHTVHTDTGEVAGKRLLIVRLASVRDGKAHGLTVVVAPTAHSIPTAYGTWKRRAREVTRLFPSLVQTVQLQSVRECVVPPFMLGVAKLSAVHGFPNVCDTSPSPKAG